MRAKFSIQILLWLALILALVGSLRHVAWGFSTLEQGDLVTGYVQAVAVDVGLFALAVGIQQRRKDSRGTRGLWLGVLMFSAVSTYANLLHGLYFQSDLGLSSWAWLVSMRPFVLSGVLPLLVVYLSEVAASDYQHSVKVAERERKQVERQSVKVTAGSTDFEATPEAAARARLARLVSKEEAMDRLLTVYRDNPDASYAQAGRAIGRSRTTVGSYLSELEDARRIDRNGQGVQVLEG